MDLASVVAALASVGVRVSGSNPNNNIQGDSSRACPTGLAGPEPSGTHNDPGQHFHGSRGYLNVVPLVSQPQLAPQYGPCRLRNLRRRNDYAAVVLCERGPQRNALRKPKLPKKDTNQQLWRPRLQSRSQSKLAIKQLESPSLR